MVMSEHELTQARAELMQLKAEAEARQMPSYEPEKVPMSWSAPGSDTPGAKAVRLRKARTEVERIVFRIAAEHRVPYASTAALNESYAELAEAARALVFAQERWDAHVAEREVAGAPAFHVIHPTKADFELVNG